MAMTSHAFDHVPNLKDPILAVIDRHQDAWSVFQVAPEGEASEAASLETCDALTALLGASCATRFGSIALLQHLRWWLAEEAVNADGYGEHWQMAQARAADLTLFLGTPPVPAPPSQWQPIGHAASRVVRRARLYDGPAFDFAAREDQPGAIEPWQAIAPIRPDTPYSRSLRLLDGMGESFAALAVICAGAVIIALATLA
ncbi:hypothetical protein [Methylobacterium goesingense]|uniref:Uncharacterized protein n=1 Tax=Methylobacterium goesingense TaxID=243690 RepID=A0ABV2LC00_9HYPH|nr:hypothetical protein [Methylobacterium goesingense]GJD73858.1 hypothetical protein CFIICLFH_2088 [Methylobacterium goesingense]